ncbi:MAG: hypothetical protein GYA34_17145 [Chloroflexi bacterium]|nr:hypothetical protein [Chloroflexota bacterium]
MTQIVDRELELLKRFEPVVYYTKGEKFFPIAVQQYISQCSLWSKRLDEPAKQLVPQGELTIEKLCAAYEAPPGTIIFLKYIEPLDLVELAKYKINQAVDSLAEKPAKNIFRRGVGRLARVGYGSRLVDTLFSLTLFFRGRVPGDTAAAAALAYEKMQEECGSYTCYGRLVRENGWLVLQYWYFYPFNNWRSGFFGVNDHEGDWEMACIYCSEVPSDDPQNPHIQPEWVAYASHDYSGDDLRRHWQDPEVEKINNHPVIFAGAGSHASYFSAGEYLTELELPFLKVFVDLVDKLQKIWFNTLRQAGLKVKSSTFNVFRIPFVDYARGDGISIGNDQSCEWQLIKLDDTTPWAVNYRGLWGLYAQDPIAGENAPAGPVYNRDGSVRRSWYDPVGWAGLDKVPPGSKAQEFIAEQRKQILTHQNEIEKLIKDKSEALFRLGIEAAACQEQPHLESITQATTSKVKALSVELNQLRRELTENKAKLEALDAYDVKIKKGELGSLRQHIRRPRRSSPPTHTRLNLFAEFLAAGSIGFLMIGIVGIVLFARQYLIIGLVMMVGFMLFMEAVFRRQLPALINSVAICLAVISALVIIYEFFWQLVVIGILMAGLFIIWENIREIRL